MAPFSPGGMGVTSPLDPGRDSPFNPASKTPFPQLSRFGAPGAPLSNGNLSSSSTIERQTCLLCATSRLCERCLTGLAPILFRPMSSTSLSPFKCGTRSAFSFGGKAETTRKSQSPRSLPVSTSNTPTSTCPSPDPHDRMVPFRLTMDQARSVRDEATVSRARSRVEPRSTSWTCWSKCSMTIRSGRL